MHFCISVILQPGKYIPKYFHRYKMWFNTNFVLPKHFSAIFDKKSSFSTKNKKSSEKNKVIITRKNYIVNSQ